MYILECSDKSLYVGSTWDLERRVGQHQAGEGAEYTSRRLPVRLLYFEWFIHIESAYVREKQVQNWSRAKRLALIRGDMEMLSRRSRKPKRPPVIE